MKRIASWFVMIACMLTFCLVIRIDILLIGYMISLYNQLTPFLKILAIVIGGFFMLGITLTPVYYGSLLTVAASEKVCSSKKGTRYIAFGITLVVLGLLEVICYPEYMLNFIILSLYAAALMGHGISAKKSTRKKMGEEKPTEKEATKRTNKWKGRWTVGKVMIIIAALDFVNTMIGIKSATQSSLTFSFLLELGIAAAGVGLHFLEVGIKDKIAKKRAQDKDERITND